MGCSGPQWWMWLNALRPGEKRLEQVYVRDYFAFYPCPWIGTDSQWGLEGREASQFWSDFFPIPEAGGPCGRSPWSREDGQVYSVDMKYADGRHGTSNCSSEPVEAVLLHAERIPCEGRRPCPRALTAACGICPVGQRVGHLPEPDWYFPWGADVRGDKADRRRKPAAAGGPEDNVDTLLVVDRAAMTW